MKDDVMVTARFDAEDLALLEGLMAHEKLSRSDIIRRAVRAYAKQLKVKPKKK